MANTSTKKLPESVQLFISQYQNLKFNDKTVNTPYYINVKRVRGELRVLVGKGIPEELVEETLIFSKLRGFDLQNSSEGEIRKFMISQGLGIDCSGFVSHIYDQWLRREFRSKIANKMHFPNQTFTGKIVHKLRPIENISVAVLTNDDNSEAIDLKDVLPGDMIKMKGLKRGDHILIITEVEYRDGIPVKIQYSNSSPYYDNENGIRFGDIEITDINKPLEHQNWQDKDKNGNCPTLEGYLKELEDNGLRRPKFIDIKS